MIYRNLSRLHALLIVFIVGCEPAGVGPEVERNAERIYAKSIVREANGEFEASLITAAEAAYPPRDSVLAVVSPEQHDRIPETGYWFYSSFDGVLIPFAVTGDAVDYYSGLIDSLKAGEGLQFLTKAALDYHGSVTFEETYVFEGSHSMTTEPLPPEAFKRVFVVRMILQWDQYCGPVCAMFINHERVVVFDEEGNLLRVFLDGPHPVAVS